MFQVDWETGDAPKDEVDLSFSWERHRRNLDESTIRSKAARLARTVGFRNFRANTEWFTRFKTREGIVRSMFRIGRGNVIDLLIIRRWHDWYQGWNSHLKTWQLEAALWRWNDNSKGIIADQLIRSEATRLARMIGVGNFRTSADWLSRFKTREEVVQEMFQLDQCLEKPQSDQTEDRSASDQVIIILLSNKTKREHNGSV